ncbi:hypothetical protein EWX79_14000 [Enterococcus faecalis]|nr:hypothetical protein [Enterococcus faecalis]EGO9190485.1 hypothetical protein [Enterococcus faecalis]
MRNSLVKNLLIIAIPIIFGLIAKAIWNVSIPIVAGAGYILFLVFLLPTVDFGITDFTTKTINPYYKATRKTIVNSETSTILIIFFAIIVCGFILYLQYTK